MLKVTVIHNHFVKGEDWMSSFIPFLSFKEGLKENIQRRKAYLTNRTFDVTVWLADLMETKLDTILKKELLSEIPYLIEEALAQPKHPLRDYFQGYELKEGEIAELFRAYPELEEEEQKEIRKWLDTNYCLTFNELVQEHPQVEVEDYVIELEEVPCRLYLDLESDSFIH